MEEGGREQQQAGIGDEFPNYEDEREKCRDFLLNFADRTNDR